MFRRMIKPSISVFDGKLQLGEFGENWPDVEMSEVKAFSFEAAVIYLWNRV